MNTTENILVLDLEATCWENNQNPKGQESEIIEIGVCLLNTKTGEISGNKGILVKPIYSKVSPFCTQLTSITAEMLEKEGVLLEDAFDILREDYDAENLTWASYGNYDLTMIKRQCEKFREDFPLGYDHINVKTLFAQLHPIRKSVGMASALKNLNIPLEGTHHRGVDDAKNIAKILFWCLNQK